MPTRRLRFRPVRHTFEELPAETDEQKQLQEAVKLRMIRLLEIPRRGIMMTPDVDPGSPIAADDERELAQLKPDLQLGYQATSRLSAALDHLYAHGAKWGADPAPGMALKAEFTVLRAVLEISASLWWLLDPEEGGTRVLRALAIKRKESEYETGAVNALHGEAASADFSSEIKDLLTRAAQEIGHDFAAVHRERLPSSTKLVDAFGPSPEWGLLVGYHWRTCSSYAHGYDWGPWHHRTFGEAHGVTTTPVPYVPLAESFLAAFDALDKVWRLWLTRARKDAGTGVPESGFLALWPTL